MTEAQAREALARAADELGYDTDARVLRTGRLAFIQVNAAVRAILASDRNGAEGGDANAAPVPQDRHARPEGIAQ